MLPSNLLRARAFKNRLIVKWARGTQPEIDLCRELIKVYRESIGGEVKQLISKLEDLEDYYESMGFDYKFIRGLTILLDRKCTFKKKETPVKPFDLRKRVFEICNLKFGGFASCKSEKESVLELTAKETGLEKREIEESLWADLEEKTLVDSFSQVEPQELLKNYNLSLLQTALFKALNLKVETSAPGWELKGLVRAVKFRKLMYQVEKINGGVVLNVNGPASILKLTTRYGASLAKLIPNITSLSNWKIEASVIRGGDRKRILKLKIGSEKRGFFPLTHGLKPSYDSEIERKAASLFSSLGWKVEREPDALLAGNYLFFPDFKLKKGLLSIYAEVMGFWTNDYIEKKINKLMKIEESILILADKKMACSKIKSLPHRVIVYNGKPSVAPTSKILLEIEKERKEMITQELRGKITSIKLKQVSTVEEIAKKTGATVNQVQSFLKHENIHGYNVIGGVVASKETLENMRKALAESKVKNLAEASKTLLKLGFPPESHVTVIKAMGYKLKWKSMKPEDIEIENKEETT